VTARQRVGQRAVDLGDDLIADIRRIEHGLRAVAAGTVAVLAARWRTTGAAA